MCRSDRVLPPSERRKIALFTNVAEEAVISAIDVDCIYDMPSVLHNQNLDEIVLRKLAVDAPPANLEEWDRVVDGLMHPEREVVVGMVGKYTDLTESYKSLNEALSHAGISRKTKVIIHYIDSEILQDGDLSPLDEVDAILVPGGFGSRGVEGKIKAVQHARENNIPYLGICLGMQVAAIEFARTDLGGTMRLGGQECYLTKGTIVHGLYGNDVIVERHRHRYEFNNRYLDKLVEHGLIIAGRSATAIRCSVVL